MKAVVLLILSLLLCGPLATAPAQTLPAKAVTIYADSIAFIQREGEVPFRNRRTTLAGIPGAVEGTIWVGSKGPFGVLSVLFGQDTLAVDETARNYAEVLEANVGKRATVTYEINGELEDVIGYVEKPELGADLFPIRRIGGGTTFLRRGQIRQVTVEGKTATRFQRRLLSRATTVVIDSALDTARLAQSYYRRGMSWYPQYRLQVGDTSVQLLLQALVDNQMTDEPIDQAAITLVNGPAPLQSPQAGGGLATARQTYHLGRRSLRGEKTTYLPVARYQLPASRQNQVSFPLNVDFSGDSPRPLREQQATVYNSVRFRHDTTPLPGGQVLLVDSLGRALRQTRLDPMSTGALTSFSLEAMPKVKARQVNEVLNVEEGEKLDDGNRYDRISVRTTILLTNEADSAKQVAVDAVIPGRLQSTSNAESEGLAEQPRGNPLHRLRWSLPVPPGDRQRLGVTYRYLLPEED